MYDDHDHQDIIERGNAICREVRQVDLLRDQVARLQEQIDAAWEATGMKRSDNPGALSQAILSLRTLY